MLAYSSTLVSTGSERDDAEFPRTQHDEIATRARVRDAVERVDSLLAMLVAARWGELADPSDVKQESRALGELREVAVLCAELEFAERHRRDIDLYGVRSACESLVRALSGASEKRSWNTYLIDTCRTSEPIRTLRSAAGKSLMRLVCDVYR